MHKKIGLTMWGQHIKTKKWKIYNENPFFFVSQNPPLPIKGDFFDQIKMSINCFETRYSWTYKNEPDLNLSTPGRWYSLSFVGHAHLWRPTQKDFLNLIFLKISLFVNVLGGFGDGDH